VERLSRRPRDRWCSVLRWPTVPGASGLPGGLTRRDAGIRAPLSRGGRVHPLGPLLAPVPSAFPKASTQSICKQEQLLHSCPPFSQHDPENHLQIRSFPFPASPLSLTSRFDFTFDNYHTTLRSIWFDRLTQFQHESDPVSTHTGHTASISFRCDCNRLSCGLVVAHPKPSTRPGRSSQTRHIHRAVKE
jgi:hypothetical protein